MTLVAAFAANNRTPVLVGDLLMSGSERNDRTVLIPTQVAITGVFPQGSGRSITGLRQKLVLIDDNLAVGWAGSLIGAKVALQELQETVTKRGITTDTVNGFLTDYGPELRRSDVALAGWYCYDSSWIPFGFDSLGAPTTNFGTVLAVGTGAESAIQWAEQIEGVPEITTLSPLIAAKSGAMMASDMLLDEIMARRNLANYFGGGYEIVYPNHLNQFRKVQNVTYLIWRATVVEGEVRVYNDGNPLWLSKLFYINGHLIIRSTKLDLSADQAEKRVIDQLNCVAPLLSPSRSMEIPKDLLHYDSRLVCNCVLVDIADRHFVFSTVDYSRRDEEILLRSTGFSDSLQLDVHLGALRRVCQAALADTADLKEVQPSL